MSKKDVAAPSNVGAHFDYKTVSPSVAKFLRGQADRIHRTASRSIIQIGKDLVGAKHYLSHGLFLRWVEDEVGLSARTAQAYMQATQWVASKGATVAYLPPSILYLLSSPSTPEELIDDVLRRVETGERLSAQAVRQQVKELKKSKRDRPAANPSGDPKPQRLKSASGTEDDDPLISEAVGILARALPQADYSRIKTILTSKTVLDDPELATKIASAFRTVERARLELQSDRGDYQAFRLSGFPAVGLRVASRGFRHPS
jgi:hypothetical protein